MSTFELLLPCNIVPRGVIIDAEGTPVTLSPLSSISELEVKFTLEDKTNPILVLVESLSKILFKCSVIRILNFLSIVSLCVR